MSGVINAILEFVTSHWLALAAFAAGVVLLVVISWTRKLIRRLSPDEKSEPAPTRVAERSGPMVTSGFDGPAAAVTGMEDTNSVRERYREIIRDLREDNEALKERVCEVTQLNAVLAPLIKELNSNVDRRRMGPIVLRVLQRIFEPKQALVFLMEDDHETLTLVGQVGADQVSSGFQMLIGDGFAGIAAKKLVPFTKSDLESESNLVREKVQESEHPAFDTEIATPILYRGECLGVLCIGGVERLKPDDRHLLGMIADMTAMSLTNYQQYRKIQELANSDPLTRLYNKGYFLEVCEYELSMAVREERPMSVLMFDLDHFKNYNDTNGHLAGDRLLKELSDLLKRMVRERDLVARFGGEEFVVLLHGVKGEEAVQAAERIRQAIEVQPFKHRESQPLGRITTSVGVASMPTHGRDAVDLIGKADDALYAAKRAGRNQVCSASSQVEVVSLDG